MKRFPWFEIILILVVMSMSLYAALSDGQNLSWRWFTRDEAKAMMAGTHPEAYPPMRFAIAHHVLKAWLDRG